MDVSTTSTIFQQMGNELSENRSSVLLIPRLYLHNSDSSMTHMSVTTDLTPLSCRALLFLRVCEFSSAASPSKQPAPDQVHFYTK